MKKVGQFVLIAGFGLWVIDGLPLPSFANRDVDRLITASIATPEESPSAQPASPAQSASRNMLLGQAILPPEMTPRSDEPVTPAPAPRPATRTTPTGVDESALRYFARQGDARRLNAEIARLRALYPTWQPPADPAAAEVYADPELDRMWELFSEERYADVREAIARRDVAEPGWVPPASLLELLDQADTRTRLTNASDARQWAQVISLAANTPNLLTCDYVDIMWRVAEAFAETGRESRAKDAYTYLLTACNDENERLATVQKAMEHLPDADIDALLALERGDEFQPIRDERIRRRVGAIAEVAEGVASATDLARLEQLAADEDDAGDPLLLGWYNYRRDNPARALEWFRKASDRDPASAKAAEGNTLALIDLERFAEAETIGHEWQAESEDNLAAYLIAVVGLLAIEPPVKVSEAVLRRIADVTTREKAPEAGEQMGWYAYNLGQVKTAARWFETVLKWNAAYEPAAYGLAVARLALKDRSGANEIIRAWRDRSERIAALGKPVKSEARSPTYVVDAPVYDRPDAAAPVAVPRSAPAATSRCGGTAPVHTLSPQAALPRGWCLMDLNRPVEAAAAFNIALRSSNADVRSDAAYGASLANLRSGVTNHAAVAATAAAQPADRQIDLTVDILTQQALAAYAEGRYVETIIALDERDTLAPMQNDLMVLRGFAYLKYGRVADAKRIFQAAAATGLPDAIRGLAEVQAIQTGVR